MKKNVIYIFALCTIFAACNKRDSALILGFEDVRYIKTFKEIKDLQVDTTFEMNTHVNFMAVVDTLLILQSGSWNIHCLPQMSPFGNLFSRGHAKGEFIQIPAVYKSAFFKDGGDLYTVVYDVQRGKCLKVNISKSILNDSLYIEDVRHKVVSRLDRYLYIDDSTYVTRANVKGTKPKKLSYFRNYEDVQNENFDKLNSIDIASDDYNSLSAICGYNKKNNVIIQQYTDFNIINIIPLIPQNTSGITLCYGEKGISLEDVVDNNRAVRFYYGLRVYDDYFAVLCIKDKKHPTIQFYGYDGSALVEYKLAKPAMCFDIDWKNCHLYAYNDEEGTLVRYNIQK